MESNKNQAGLQRACTQSEVTGSPAEIYRAGVQIHIIPNVITSSCVQMYKNQTISYKYIITHIGADPKSNKS